jgi:long-chain acyl-CoA synthetase
VVLHADASVRADELRDWINERVGARYQRVHAVQIMDDFPRNAAGKTLKREMRDASVAKGTPPPSRAGLCTHLTPSAQ